MPTPNTITSPEQSGVLSLLNLARPASDGSGALPLQGGVDKLIEVMMRGMANTRSENMAKIAAKDAATAPTPEIHAKTRVDPNTGQQIHDVSYKNVVFGDAQKNVQDAYDDPQKAVDAALAETATRYHLDQPGQGGQYPPDLQQSVLDSFGGKYKAERDAGHGPLSALLHAATLTALPDTLERSREAELAKTVDQGRKVQALQYAKAELPIVQELYKQGNQNLADRRATIAEKNQADQERKRVLGGLLTSGQLHTLGSDEDSAVQQLDLLVPGGLKPNEITQSRLQFRRDQKGADLARSQSVSKLISGISEKSVQLSENPADYVASLASGIPGGLNIAEQRRAMERVLASQRTLRSMDAKESAQLSLEAERTRQIRRSNDLAEAAQKQLSPETVGKLADRVAEDPTAYYTPLVQAKDAGAKRVKEALDVELTARFGRAPDKITDPEKQRLDAVNQGTRDVAFVEQIIGKWQKRGIPLNGIGVGRLNEKTASLGDADVAAAVRGVPYKMRDEYQRDLGTVRVALNTLFIRELKSNLSGRPAEKLAEMIHTTAPQLIQGGPLLAGALTGVQREFYNAKSTILDRAWGGKAPGSGAAVPTGAVLHWNITKKVWE